PFQRITIATHARLDSRLSYGFVAGPGVYETTVTRPDLFRAYLTEQIKLLIENHVSDKPLHGEIELAGMAGEFYRQRVGQHLEIGLKALTKLKSQEQERLHSRKLRSFAEVAFQ